MVLTPQQRKEIKEYIFDASKYIETHNEVYDHVINALEDSNAVYTIALVTKIIEDDFGSFDEIKRQEKLYQQQINKKQSKLFLTELKNSFKWPGLLANGANLMLCLIIYSSSARLAINTKPLTAAIFLCFMLVTLYMYTKIGLRKRKFKKYSIFDNALGSLSTFGLFTGVFVFYWFVSDESMVSLSKHHKLIVLLILYFLCSLYVRSFRKFYRQKIKILIA